MIFYFKIYSVGYTCGEFSKYVQAGDQLTQCYFVIMAILKLRYAVYTGAYDFYSGGIIISIRHSNME